MKKRKLNSAEKRNLVEFLIFCVVFLTVMAVITSVKQHF